ncbi:TVP38/TMEM64 family protein [Solibacillus sp. R5-41]|uniref:TVP38/TMEM64 family protein n=1 Tax=Solibacillus sp. R5-41 TaxID=2048654 RepID=UPI000C12849D|nr:VTT domain-containing protein [Solibacillus sp. R5-41]ATP42018.1 TVP38/TMEM64 family protein [Solibacillus sp. R5-41]
MKKKLIIFIIWISLVYILKHLNLLSFDMNSLKAFIFENKNYAYFLFIGLWIVRLLFLIPGTMLMILGGVCFSPIEAFFLSTAGMALSATLVFLVSKSFVGHKLKKYLVNRHPEMNDLLEKYNYKFLALGIICPVAPADVICFLSASVRIKYVTYILTILIASAPLRMLYSLIGTSLGESKVGLVFVIVSLVLVFIASIKIWNKIKKNQYKGC